MTALICPKCKEDSFTWMIDEEISPLTIWGCYNCNYEAFEDESEERPCNHCSTHTEIKLRDKTKEYWWCNHCEKSI